MKVVVIGGHITPAFAMMDALNQMHPKTEFYFFGRMHTREGDTAISAEYTLVTERNVPFYSITTGKLHRHLHWRTIYSLLKIPVGFFQSLWYLSQIKPNIVCSFGSYLAVPVVIAAWILRIPVVTHEQVLVPGLATRIIARFCNVVAVSFLESKRFYAHVRTEVTGNPLRKEVFVHHNRFNVADKDLPVVYVTGGNQGAHAVNSAVFIALHELLNFCTVIHQTGNSKVYRDFEKAEDIRKKLSPHLRERYYPFEYVGPELIGDIYHLSDLVVSRAGVNTLCELLALGKKSIIVPIPGHKEQQYNAKFFAKIGLGVSIKQHDLSVGTLIDTVKSMIESKTPFEVLEEARSLVYTDADVRLSKLVFATASKR